MTLAAIAATLLVALAVVGVATGGVADLYPLLLLGWPVVGALVVRQRSDNRVGKAMIVFAFGFAMSSLAEAYVHLDHMGREMPGTDLAAWVAGWVFAGAILLPVGFLIAAFPSGEIAATWVRRTFAALTVTVVVVTLARMILPVPVTADRLEGLDNPWALDGIERWIPVVDMVANLGLALLAVLVVDLVRRWRRSRDVERLQMRWIAWTLLAFVLALSVTTLMRVAGFSEEVMAVADNLAWLSFLGILPVSIGIAVTRYRLYEIDRIVSRTVTYGLVAILLAGVYALGVFLLRDLLPFEGPLPVAGSTLAVAASFNPLRRWLQSRVDRRFNRSRYDHQRVATDFSHSLREEMDPGQVVRGLMGAVETTMQPQYLAVWVRGVSSG